MKIMPPPTHLDFRAKGLKDIGVEGGEIDSQMSSGLTPVYLTLLFALCYSCLRVKKNGVGWGTNNPFPPLALPRFILLIIFFSK